MACSWLAWVDSAERRHSFDKSSNPITRCSQHCGTATILTSDAGLLPAARRSPNSSDPRQIAADRLEHDRTQQLTPVETCVPEVAIDSTHVASQPAPGRRPHRPGVDAEGRRRSRPPTPGGFGARGRLDTGGHDTGRMRRAGFVEMKSSNPEGPALCKPATRCHAAPARPSPNSATVGATRNHR